MESYIRGVTKAWLLVEAQPDPEDLLQPDLNGNQDGWGQQQRWSPSGSERFV